MSVTVITSQVPKPTRRYIFSFHIRLTNPMWRFERRRLLAEQERIRKEHDELKARLLESNHDFIPWVLPEIKCVSGYGPFSKYERVEIPVGSYR